MGTFDAQFLQDTIDVSWPRISGDIPLALASGWRGAMLAPATSSRVAASVVSRQRDLQRPASLPD